MGRVVVGRDISSEEWMCLKAKMEKRRSK